MCKWKLRLDKLLLCFFFYSILLLRLLTNVYTPFGHNNEIIALPFHSRLCCLDWNMKIYHGILASHRTPMMILSVCLVYLFRFVEWKFYNVVWKKKRFFFSIKSFIFFTLMFSSLSVTRYVINIKVQFVLRLTLIDCLFYFIFLLFTHKHSHSVWCCWKWNHRNEANANFFETSSNDGRLNFTFCRSDATSKRRYGCCRQCCRRWWVFIA